MTEVVLTEALGESLSPSRVITYLTRPAKWYFRYLVRLCKPATGVLTLGKAFHATLARNFGQKMNTGRDMETGDLTDAFTRSGYLQWQKPCYAGTKVQRSMPRPGKSLLERTWQKRHRQ